MDDEERGRDMMNQPNQKRGQFSFTLSGMLWLVAALLLCALSVAAAAEEAAPAASDGKGNVADANTAPCKGLKPFNNIDELLYQFYINLESDCLFEMPTAELEEVWGIKILDDERVKPRNFYPLSETEFFNRPYKTKKDAFYMERTQAAIQDTDGKYRNPINRFILKPTNEYFEKHGPLFPDEKFPKLLPATNKHSARYKYYYVSADGARAIQITEKGEVELWRSSKPPVNMRIKKKPDQSKNGNSATAAANAGGAPCRGLKPYKNLDELLYQIYINLDSDCLFKMPVAELERVWDIKILSPERAQGEDAYRLRTSSDFANKPYKSDKDAFYIKMHLGIVTTLQNMSKNTEKTNQIDIIITEEYLKKYGTLFSEGNLPKLLPAPLSRRMPPLMTSHGNLRRPEQQKRKPEIMRPGYTYYWFNPAPPHVIIFDVWPGGVTVISAW